MIKNYSEAGTICGKKYCVKTDWRWDKEFTMNKLEEFVKKLKNGEPVLYSDMRKISYVKIEKHKFCQIRYIGWIKTNPQPLNSKQIIWQILRIALLAVKQTYI